MSNIHQIKQVQAKTYIDEALNNAVDGDIFLLEKGNYYLNATVLIREKKNITIRGMTGNPNDVSVTQEGTVLNEDNGETIYHDGFAINDSKYINLDSFTLIVDKDNGTPITLSVNGSSHVKVTNCRFYGNSSNFAVYFSGPTGVTAAAETLAAYYANDLCSSNVFEKNMVISYFPHDGVVFGLQTNGIMQDNIVYGCRYAVYMVRDTLVHNNHSYDSMSNGFVCSVPCYNLDITNNVVKNSAATGINVMEQLEHGDTATESFLINISSNDISGCLNGIDVVDCKDIVVSNNTIVRCTDNGVTTLRSENCDIKCNMILNCRVGIIVSVQTFNTQIHENQIYNYHPLNTSKNGIKLEKDTGDNHIHSNIINIHDPKYQENHEMNFVIDYDSAPDGDYVPDDRVNNIENNIIRNSFDYYGHLSIISM